MTVHSMQGQEITAEEFLGEQPTTIPEIREWRKSRLAGAFRLLAKFGMNESAAGHITARDPEYLDHFWVNPAIVPYSHIRASDLLLVDSTGRVVEGRGVLNGAAFAIHSTIHHARPDVIAAAHSHSPYGKAWSMLGRLLDPLSQDACAFYQDHGLYDDFTGVVFGIDEGERIVEALGSTKAAILRNHGLLTVGGSVEEAAWWFITMEHTCRGQILAESAGRPILIDPETAALTAEQVGTPLSARINFAQLWAVISAEQPDLFH